MPAGLTLSPHAMQMPQGPLPSLLAPPTAGRPWGPVGTPLHPAPPLPRPAAAAGMQAGGWVHEQRMGASASAAGATLHAACAAAALGARTWLSVPSPKSPYCSASATVFSSVSRPSTSAMTWGAGGGAAGGVAAEQGPPPPQPCNLRVRAGGPHTPRSPARGVARTGALMYTLVLCLRGSRRPLEVPPSTDRRLGPPCIIIDRRSSTRACASRRRGCSRAAKLSPRWSAEADAGSAPACA